MHHSPCSPNTGLGSESPISRGGRSSSKWPHISSDMSFPSREEERLHSHQRQSVQANTAPWSSWSPPSEWVPKGPNWLDGRGSRWQRVNLAAGQKVEWRVRIQGSHRRATKPVSASSYSTFNKWFRRRRSQDPDFNSWESARIFLNCLCPLTQNDAYTWLRGSKN